MKTKRGLPEMTWLADKELWRKRGTYKGHKYNITAKEPEDVVAKIKAFEARIDGGIIDETLTMFQFIQRWYPTKIAGLKPKSIEVYKNCIDNHVIPKLGNLLVKDVKPLHIDGLMAGLDGKSSSLQRKVLYTMRQIFDSAVENDVIRKNPCSKRKAGGEKEKAKVPLSHEQQDRLTSAVHGTRAELFTLLCLYAGLRREEALGLLWTDVHLDGDAPYLDVRHTTTLESNGKATHSPDLKSPSAYRTIPLPPQLAYALSRWKGIKDSIFVVPAEETKKEMSLAAFRRMWQIVIGYKEKVVKRDENGKPVKDKGGKSVKITKQYPGLVDFYVSPHLLRHTYITELCASGLDIKKIQYLAGHATVKMTLDIYTHVTQNKPEQLAPDIKKAFMRTPAGILRDIKPA